MLRRCAAPIQRVAQWTNSFMRRQLSLLRAAIREFVEQRQKILKLQADVRARGLDLDEARRAIEQLKGDITRGRQAEEAQRAAVVDNSLEKTLAEFALPLTQLATQMRLAENEGKPLNPKDVFAVLKRLLKNAQAVGLCLEGTVGEVVAFDPNSHDIIGADGVISPGARATVRMPGASFRGKVIRKAAVEPCAS
jgi:hypothetical protein